MLLNGTARQARIAAYKNKVKQKLANKIIDTSKPEFADLVSDRGQPMSSLNGAIILERDLGEDGRLRGVVSIDVDDLAAILPDLKNDTENKSGWKKHLDKFKAEGIDVDGLLADVTDPDSSEYELSAQEELATLDIDSMSDAEAKQKLKDIKAKLTLERGAL